MNSLQWTSYSEVFSSSASNCSSHLQGNQHYRYHTPSIPTRVSRKSTSFQTSYSPGKTPIVSFEVSIPNDCSNWWNSCGWLGKPKQSKRTWAQERAPTRKKNHISHLALSRKPQKTYNSPVSIMAIQSYTWRIQGPGERAFLWYALAIMGAVGLFLALQ